MHITWLISLASLIIGGLAGWAASQYRARAILRLHDARLQQALAEARKDSLTGLWNRKAFDEYLAIQTSIARRYRVPFSVLLIDVDHFKAINDTYGHLAGDAALRELAAVLKASARESDLVTRYGGEEFSLLLPQTDGSGAQVLACRIRSRLAASVIRAGGLELKMQVSIGLATLLPGEPPEKLVERADRALYAAKQAGRNRIHVHDGERPVDATPAD